MTASEKHALKERVIRSAFSEEAGGGSSDADEAPGHGAMRPPTPLSGRMTAWAWIRGHSVASVAFAALAIVVAGGGIAFAAQSSLPGDVLYPVKVGVIEPIQGSFVADAAGEASWEARLISRRLTEAETLASEGKLDATNVTELERLLDEHTAAYAMAVNDVAASLSPERARGIGATLVATIAAHAKLFNDITAYASTTEATTSKLGENWEAAVQLSGKAAAHVKDPEGSWMQDDRMPGTPVRMDKGSVDLKSAAGDAAAFIKGLFGR